MRITKAEYKRRARKAADTKKTNSLQKTRKRAARIASRKNILSEKKFVERLRRNGYLAFSTGKAQGPPDIVAYKNRKLSFFEIKPSNPKARKDALFKKTQSDWIKKYCFNKRVDVNLVFYKGSRPFKYAEIKISKKNISDFVNKQKNLDDIIERTKILPYK